MPGRHGLRLSLILALILAATPAMAAATVVLDSIALDAPRVITFRAVAPDGSGGGYPIDLRLAFDEDGRLVHDGSCLVDGEVVKAKGKVFLESDGWHLKLKLKSPSEALERVKVKIVGRLDPDDARATITYSKGPRGKLDPVETTVTLSIETVSVGLRLRPFHGSDDEILGDGTFLGGYRGRRAATLSSARLRDGELKFKLKHGRDKLKFSGVVQPDGSAVGTLKYKFRPATGKIETYIVPPLFDLEPPRVTAVEVEPDAVGDVPVTVRHTEDRGGTVTLVVEVSRDERVTWHDARLTGRSGNTAPADVDGETEILWNSLADVGIHTSRTVWIRVSAIEAGAGGEPFAVETHAIDNLRVKSEHVQYHMVHYGELTPAAIAVAERHDLVIVHPFGGDLHRPEIAEIQDGLDPDDPADDVLVLGYISVGEDLRTIGIPAVEMKKDPRFIGDGSGPRVDPRGPGLEGGSLRDLPVLGNPSPHGSGYASYYLDDTYPDGMPDQNPIFYGAFTNAGDPAWFDVLENLTFDRDGHPGMLEILTTTTGRGLGCNGLFMDTFDTPAPNVFTHPDYTDNPTDFEWTGPGFSVFLRRARAAHPRALLLQNRGLFFYDCTYPHYEHNAAEVVDFVFFESYRTDNNLDSDVVVEFYLDNKYNVAPKLMAEANRENGFTVVSLGYAEGPPDVVRHETLLGLSTVGIGTLRQDILEAHAVGFRHYIGNLEVDLANMFVLNEEDFADDAPPVWNSTYNVNAGDWPELSGPPVPRVGIQQAEPGGDFVTVRWDVALDMHRVRYALWYQDRPFDFTAPDPLANATRRELAFGMGRGYTQGSAPATFPYEEVIANLTPGVEYHFLIRARDESPNANEEKNTVTVSATPIGNTWAEITIDGSYDDWDDIRPSYSDAADPAASDGPDWREVWLANDDEFLYVRIRSGHAFDAGEHFLAYIDADDDVGTGLRDPSNGIVGSDLLIFGNEVYRQITNFNDGYLGSFETSARWDVTEIEMAIPRAFFEIVEEGSKAVTIRFHNDHSQDFAPDGTAMKYVFETDD